MSIGIEPQDHAPHPPEGAAPPSAPGAGARTTGKLVRDAWLKSNGRVGSALAGAGGLCTRSCGQRPHELARVNRPVAPTQLEMQLRLGDIAGRANARDDLTARDLVTALNQNQIAVGIGGNPAIRVLDENKIAVASQLV